MRTYLKKNLYAKVTTYGCRPDYRALILWFTIVTMYKIKVIMALLPKVWLRLGNRDVNVVT